MHRIQIDEMVYTFLDHRKLINDAYNATGMEKYALRAELFQFHSKETKHLLDREDIPKKRRRKTKSIQPILDETCNETLRLTEALKALRKLLPSVEQPKQVISRYWEQLTANDFPKFKGANTISSYQRIDQLVDAINFIVPPFCRFYNYDIVELSKLIELAELPMPFDLIVLDPPWRNKYIRRLKRHYLGYNMLECKQLQEIPIGKLTHEHSIVAIWCTNSRQHQQALLQELLPAWNLRPLKALKWLKLNTSGEPISAFNNAAEDNGKQPFEMLYIACHRNAALDFGVKLEEVEALMSIPSIIHSHKPPLLDWLSTYFSFGVNPKCLELFARYLQPNFTSFGTEVLKLMDERLYDKEEILEGS